MKPHINNIYAALRRTLRRGSFRVVAAVAAAVAAAVTLLLLASCSTTRRIEEGEQLYTGVKGVQFTAPEGTKIPDELKSDIKSATDVPPNNSFFKSSSVRWPLPIGLWVYNNWSNPPSGLKHWLYEKLAADPVLISDVRPEVRVRMIDEILQNNGYFRGAASFDLNTSKRDPKKASITYKVLTGAPYPLDSIYLPPDTCELFQLIDSVASRDPYLRHGQRYSTDSLSTVRNRITNALRNRGYYFFRPEYIEYLADSVRNPRNIDLRLDVAANAPAQALTRYRTGRVTVYAFRNQGGGTPDTIPTPRATLIQMMPSRLRSAIVPECVTFRPNRYFSVRDMDRTQTRLSRLGIFKTIAIDVVPDSLSADPLLDVAISCTFDQPLEASIEVNASSKSNSYVGPGLIFGVTNRNLFGGGEQFTTTLTGSYEWQTGGNNSSVFNSYEFGLATTLAVPRLIAPKFVKRIRRDLNWTRFTLNADVLNRPHYFRMAQFNAGMSYDWQSSRRSSHSFTPFKLTYTKLMNTTADFDDIIAHNPAIALSFQSQFIPQMAYTYTYSRAYNRYNEITWTFTLQEAGNLFWAVGEADGVHSQKKLFGTPFSQFVKGSTQIVYNLRLWGEHWLVSRVAVGAEHAYANSQEVPYAEQFYVGGANSIRAFTVRSLGPGSYRPPKSLIDGYFDQTGTCKLEMNVEYRFPIFGPLHGALFLDSGNVWLLRRDPQRPGGELRASTFLNELALGTGAGLRLDISMLVVRADLGIGIHAPYKTDRSGYYNMTSFKNSLAFHLAIGYPF